MRGVEILGEEEEISAVDASPEPANAPPPEEVPKISDAQSAIREAYEKNIGPWADCPGTGYSKRRNAIDALKEKLEGLREHGS